MHNSLLLNFIIAMKLLFMPKLMPKIFMPVWPVFIISPAGKEHSNLFSIFGYLNGYLTTRVHQLKTRNPEPFTKICYLNAVCLNSDFFHVGHSDMLGQVQGSAAITYHNYLAILCFIAFHLDLKRPKHSDHMTQVKNTNHTSTRGSVSSCGGRHHGCNGGHGGHGHGHDPNQNSKCISIPWDLWLSLPDSAEETIT